MKKLRICALFFFVCTALITPVCVSAQKNFLRGLRKTQKNAANLQKQAFKQFRRCKMPRVSPGLPLHRTVSEGVASARREALLAPALQAGMSLSSRGVSVPAEKGLKVSFPGKQRADAIIFDLDGTLLDSLSAWEHSGTNFLRAQGITPPEGLDDILVKMSLMDGARLVKERFGLVQSPEEILRRTLEPVRRRYFEDIAAKPGVPETLMRLKQEGVKLCIATASDRELAEGALARLGLLGFFDFIVTCDEVGVGKRSPAVYEEALRRLGTEKSRTLVAEDARYALETAQKAGFATVGVADSHTPSADTEKIREAADYYVEHFLNGVFKK